MHGSTAKLIIDYVDSLDEKELRENLVVALSANDRLFVESFCKKGE